MMSLKAMEYVVPFVGSPRRLSKPKPIFRFGVLQLRVDRVEILHPREIASEVFYFHILQVSVRALFVL